MTLLSQFADSLELHFQLEMPQTQVTMSRDEEKMTDYELLANEIKELRKAVNPPVPNPAPLGLIAFGFTTSLLQVKHTRLSGNDASETSGVQVVVTGFAMFLGGLLQIIVGLCEIRTNNLFGFTAFSLFGGLWMSIATNDIVQWIADDAPVANPKASQTWLFNTAIFSTILWIMTFKFNKTMWVLFLSLVITLFFLGFGVDNESVDKVGGYLGLLTSGIAYWLAFAQLFNHYIGEGTEIIPLGAPIIGKRPGI